MKMAKGGKYARTELLKKRRFGGRWEKYGLLSMKEIKNERIKNEL